MNKLREKIVEDFINALSEDVIPWERDWYMTVTPVNSNGNVYHGLNRYMLSFVQDEMKYKDNRWMTFKQANDKGYHVKKGEKGTRIEFWSLYDKERKCKITGEQAALLSSEEAKERLVPLVQEYTVFNAEQIEGIPPQKITDREQISVKELAKARDRIISGMDVGFKEGGDKAFYSPAEDFIMLPEAHKFKSDYSYMATFLHEAAHATGNEKRLNRELSTVFGSLEYAKEELRAEISAAFMAQSIRLNEKGIQNHKSYIQSWISLFKNKPEELFAAIRDAEKISDYVIEKGQFKCMEYTESKEEYIEKMDSAFAENKPVSKTERAVYSQVMKERYSEKSLKTIAEETKKAIKDKEYEREM